jgi:hypothetical protein
MDEVLVEPDPEQTLIDALQPLLSELYGEEPVKVSTRTHEGLFVKTVLTGGQGRVSRVLHPYQLTVESYGPSESAASLLGRRAGALIHQLRGTVQGGVTIAEVDQPGGLANLPDPLDDRTRYTQLFVIRMKAITE